MELSVLPPSTAELNLLLEWPDQRTRPQRLAVLGASVALHLVFFSLVLSVPSLIGQRMPERQVIVRRIPLYLPRDVMTQKAPNRAKVSKQIDLADLLPSQTSKTSTAGRRPSVRRFEMPRQAPNREMAQNSSPRILPQAPPVVMTQNSAPNLGVPGGLPAAAPLSPTTTTGPFQNVGAAPPPNPHPKLTPPKASVDAVINGLAQDTHSRNLIISDDVPESPIPGNAGSAERAPAQHSAVELESDPNGADFRQYLRTILGIVRTNWRRVVPESARMGMLRGRTVVEFIISRDGSIPKLVLADASGSDPLDRAAVAGLSMSNPLPPLPADYKGFQVRLAFTFAYNMPAR